jgi:hypothetical protein
MRVFGLLSLVIVLAITAVLVKRQLASLHVTPHVSQQSVGDVKVPDVSSPDQARQVEQQVQGDLDRASQEHAQQIERALDEGASKP